MDLDVTEVFELDVMVITLLVGGGVVPGEVEGEAVGVGVGLVLGWLGFIMLEKTSNIGTRIIIIRIIL